MALTFDALRRANVERCERSFRHPLTDWSPLEWAGAAAGEMGEAANLCKKLRRGEPIPAAEIGKEIADVVIYLDLLAASLGIDLGYTVAAKFNEVSVRRGVRDRLPLPDVAMAGVQP